MFLHISTFISLRICNSLNMYCNSLKLYDRSSNSLIDNYKEEARAHVRMYR